MNGKKTRIVATIGPASESEENLKKMIEAGMNVVRLNFSHGTHQWHQAVIQRVRKISQDLDISVGILADLQGPRIRVGNSEAFEAGDGEIIEIREEGQGNGKTLIIDTENIVSSLKAGERILVEDGLFEFEVIKAEAGKVEAKVLHGGQIKPRKGINLPDTALNIGAVTKKDEEDLQFVLGQEVDFVALSFVSNAKEIEETRAKIKKILGREDKLPQIVSKIERKEAIKNIDEIIKATDVVMVARGDLGIEMNESKVVLYQKEIIAKCLRLAKPVIVATQMLESMVNNPIPTRAEVSDVSNAVIDHTDAVMLSGETANGKFPLKTVETMSRIIKDTEDSSFDDINPGYLHEELISDYASIVDSAHEIAKSANAKAIVMLSDTGFTGRIMAHHRPDEMMLLGTNSPKTYYQLSIVWGIEPYLFAGETDREKMLDALVKKAKEENKIKTGDKIVTILGRVPGEKNIQLVGIQEV